MSDKKPTQKDFVNLINSVMGENSITENQLSKFLNEAHKINETKGTDGFIEYVKKATNAPVSNAQLKGLTDNIKKSGGASNAVDYLMNEKLITDQQANKLSQAITPPKKKKKKN